MIIETFNPETIRQVYERVDREGRRLPEGLRFVDSWIDTWLTTCYQVMETENPALLKEWVDAWRDLVSFEIIPVISSREAREKVMGKDCS